MRAIDALLLLMVLIWGTNYSIVKHAFQEIDPQAFNAVRMIIASAVFLALMVWLRRARRIVPALAGGEGTVASIFHTPAPITRSDWIRLTILGIVGHFFYQYFFIGGLARTSVANSSLLLAATPVVIALMSAALGQERVGRLHWLGAAISMFGIYLVVGHGFALGGESFTGDVMMFVAVVCWAIYTLGARDLVARHSPVGVTGLSMAIGTAIYVPIMSRNIARVDWSTVSTLSIVLMVYSALFALCVAYTIWYAAVREIGSARTSVYSNLIPLVAMATAVIFLGESLAVNKMLGAAAVLAGVALTRVGKRSVVIPAEE